jgi:uncharacterized protein DUF3891
MSDMIVRKEDDGQVLLVGQTDHSRLAGQFAAHWGNAQFATPKPFESIARAAAFHDFGYLRYETLPSFNEETGETPNFRDVLTDATRLAEYQWCFDWLFGTDAYASTIVNMHRTGLWRGRYGAMIHPEHKIRPQKPEVDAFVERNEEARAKVIAQQGWDPAELRINYRLLQVWDNLSLYFSCQKPYEDYIEPVPTSYDEREGEGVRMTLTPLGGNRIAVDPFPFDVDPVRFQLAARRLPQPKFANEAAFRKAYYQAPIELIEYELVSAARVAEMPTLEISAASR